MFEVPKSKPPYPEEFRREACELVIAGRSIPNVAAALGVSEVSLRNWMRQRRVADGEDLGDLNRDEREELRRLRRENARLRQEREILKKAAAFFAKESETG